MSALIIFLVASLTYTFFRGAAVLFKAPDEAGFFGVIVFFGAWITAFPIMVLLCLLAGLTAKDKKED